MWLLLSTAAGVPPTVLLCLNLNGIVALFSTKDVDCTYSAPNCQTHSTSYVNGRDGLVEVLKGPVPQISQLPSLVTMSIAATRMYRPLADFASSPVDIGSDSDLQYHSTKVSTFCNPTQAD